MTPAAPRRARRPFGRFMLALIILTSLAQLPMLLFLVARLGAPTWLAVALFGASNGLIASRIRYLPRPDPPPVWFEQFAVWSYFVYTTTGLWFAPGALLLWALGGPVSLGLVWLLASVLLAADACGLPHRRVKVRHLTIDLPGLPEAFDGLTVVQLTDLHAGPFAPESRLRRWVALANAQNPDVVVLTGDLIASGRRYVPALERALARLQTRYGVFAVMGNHDYFGTDNAVVALHRRLGHRLLRNAHEVLRIERRGLRGALTVAGVDDTWRDLDDLDATLQGVDPGLPIILLAHDPDLFFDAAKAGIALQISGHIHGGQLAIPFLGRAGSVLRPLRVPFVSGLYRREKATLWLGSGLGTTGAPVRIGVPSELAVLHLRRPDSTPGP